MQEQLTYMQRFGTKQQFYCF